MQKKQRSKFIAGILAVALAVSALAIGLNGTFAANDINVTLARQNGYPTLERGQSATTPTTGYRKVDTSDSSILTASLDPANGRLTATGVKAGIATAVLGTSKGALARVPYQVFDDNNIGSYTLLNGGEARLSKSGANTTAARSSFLATVPANPSGTGAITWESRNGAVATVNAASGLITAVDTGAAVILGRFTDKWGLPREIAVLAMVDVRNTSLAALLEEIAKGQTIIDLPGRDFYTGATMDALDSAVAAGKSVALGADPTETAIQNAITAIKNAISGLTKKPAAPSIVIGPDGNGNYYRPVGDPPNVYEVVNQDGSAKQPPKWIYNTGNPATNPGGNRPVGRDGGFYYVEDPSGSNIWKPVASNGGLDGSKAIWGGGNKEPGGGDDRPAVLGGDDSWYVNWGQNVFQRVNSTDPNRGLTTGNPLIGGGPNLTPGNGDDLRSAIELSDFDNRYYAGPFADSAGDPYYVGDKRPNTDGLTTGGMGAGNAAPTNPVHGTDQIYYKHPDGSFRTDKPLQQVDVFAVRIDGPRSVISPASGASAATRNYTVILAGSAAGTFTNCTWSLASNTAGVTLQSAGPAKTVTVNIPVNAEGAFDLMVTANASPVSTAHLLVTVRKTKPIGDGEVGTGRVLGTDRTGDSVVWVEIATNGNYSMIIRSAPIKGITCFNNVDHRNTYANSDLREFINNWFGSLLPADAPVRDYTVRSDAKDNPGEVFTLNGISKPTAVKSRDGQDVAFAMSFGESAKYCSTQYWAPFMTNSSLAAQNNFSKIDCSESWLRSKGASSVGTTGAYVGSLWSDGRCNQAVIETWEGSYWHYLRKEAIPVLWVESTIFD